MDIDDAFKLKLISFEQTKNLLLAFLPEERQLRAEKIFDDVTDENERIAYLRSTVIGLLIDDCARVFAENEETILEGRFSGALIDSVENRLRDAYNKVSKEAFAKVYKSQIVLDVELAGYRIISELLNCLLEAVFEPDKSYSKQLLRRIPSQYNVHSADSYERVMSILDYISGMTDVYALDLYRKITGMNLPSL